MSIETPVPHHALLNETHEISQLHEVTAPDPMVRRSGIFVSNVSFTDGTSIDLSDNSIVVFVGPNNSGKSLSLRDIYSHLNLAHHRGKSIGSIKLQRINGQDILTDYLSGYLVNDSGYRKYYFSEYSSISPGELSKVWNADRPYIGELAEIFVGRLSTDRRLADCLSADTFDYRKHANGTHPIHNLYLDEGLERRVSSLFRRAFGVDLIVHRTAGRSIPLYVGERPNLNDGENAVSRSYLDRVAELSRLEDQGDGLKSFASLLLRVWTGRHSVLLLDEPEAFLHPPQARAVGELISSGAEHDKQIFVATHSNDVIQGLLNKFPGRVNIVRLHNDVGGWKVTSLASDDVAVLWRDPILRYSNALNGIFHNRVVVTEADGDCKFYEAISEEMEISLKTTFYTYAGGKDRIPIIVRALRALHVPVRSVVDIDIFSDDVPIRKLVEAHGHSWSVFKDEIAQVRKIVQERKGWLVGSGFKARVSELLKNIDDDTMVRKDVLSRLRSLMREASPWDHIKSAGIAAFPSGEPTQRLQALLGRLRDIGIFVVPEGEIEGFCRSVGGHGPKWVEEVLGKNILHSPELENARVFVRALSSDQSWGDYTFVRTVSSPKRFDKREFFHSESTFSMALKTLGRTLWIVVAMLNIILISGWVVDFIWAKIR